MDECPRLEFIIILTHMRQIIVDKSIQRKRIVYKSNTSLIFDYFMMYFLAWMLPIISVKLIFFSAKQKFSLLELLFVLIDLWLIISLYFMNKLVVSKGKTPNENRDAIMLVLEDQYPDIVFTSGNPNLIRGKKKVGYLREQIINIILDESNVCINILNTYRGEGFSFFHGLINYFKSKNLARNFRLAMPTNNNLT